MLPSFVRLLIAALIIGIFVRTDARLLEKDNEDDDAEVPFDEADDPLLEEVTTEKGTIVRFLEPASGILLVTTDQKETEEEEPISKYKKDKKGEKGDVGEFYELMTGKKPSGRVKQALKRLKKNKETKEDRKDWPEPESGPETVDGDEGKDLGTGGHRTLGSYDEEWFKDLACRFPIPIDFCFCMTNLSGDFGLPLSSDDIYQKVYAKDGNVKQTMHYWKCNIFGWDCNWYSMGYWWTYEGWLKTVWTENDATYTFWPAVKYATGDTYHYSVYDLWDGDGWLDPNQCYTTACQDKYRCTGA